MVESQHYQRNRVLILRYSPKPKGRISCQIFSYPSVLFRLLQLSMHGLPLRINQSIAWTNTTSNQQPYPLTDSPSKDCLFFGLNLGLFWDLILGLYCDAMLSVIRWWDCCVKDRWSKGLCHGFSLLAACWFACIWYNIHINRIINIGIIIMKKLSSGFLVAQTATALSAALINNSEVKVSS